MTRHSSPSPLSPLSLFTPSHIMNTISSPLFASCLSSSFLLPLCSAYSHQHTALAHTSSKCTTLRYTSPSQPFVSYPFLSLLFSSYPLHHYITLHTLTNTTFGIYFIDGFNLIHKSRVLQVFSQNNIFTRIKHYAYVTRIGSACYLVFNYLDVNSDYLMVQFVYFFHIRFHE